MKESAFPWLYGVYGAVNVFMILAAGVMARTARRSTRRGWLAMLFVGALISLAVFGVFLIEIAAPRLLHLPYHHCPYDLVPQAPESLLAIALFLGGTFAVGWSGILGWLGNVQETRPHLGSMIGRLLQLAVLGYLWSSLMMAVELALS